MTNNTVILPRDLCDCSIDLRYLQDDVAKAADVALDAHSDIVRPAEALAACVAVRDQLNGIIAEMKRLVG